MALYAVLLLSAVALATLVVGDIIHSFESPHDEEHEHDNVLLDLAWPVFLLGTLITLVSGVVTMVAGRLRRRAALTRYSVRALGYCVLAVLVVVLVEILG
jgi:hypothetical protein